MATVLLLSLLLLLGLASAAEAQGGSAPLAVSAAATSGPASHAGSRAARGPTPAILDSREWFAGIGPTAGVVGIEYVGPFKYGYPYGAKYGVGAGITGVGARLLVTRYTDMNAPIVPDPSSYFSVGAAFHPWKWGGLKAKGLVSAEVGFINTGLVDGYAGADIGIGVARLVGGTWFGSRWLLTVRWGYGLQRNRVCGVPDYPVLPPVALAPHDSIEAGTLKGRLVSQAHMGPIAHGIVSLPDLGVTAHVDIASAFRISGIPPGRHRIAVRRIGFLPTRGSIDMPATHGSVVQIWIEPAPYYFECGDPPPAPGKIEPVS